MPDWRNNLESADLSVVVQFVKSRAKAQRPPRKTPWNFFAFFAPLRDSFSRINSNGITITALSHSIAPSRSSRQTVAKLVAESLIA
jgi:hypothetical protein